MRMWDRNSHLDSCGSDSVSASLCRHELFGLLHARGAELLDCGIGRLQRQGAAGLASALQATWQASRCWSLLPGFIPVLPERGPRWPDTRDERLGQHLGVQTADAGVGVQIWRHAGEVSYHARCHWLWERKNGTKLHHGVVRAVSAGELHFSARESGRERALLV